MYVIKNGLLYTMGAAGVMRGDLRIENGKVSLSMKAIEAAKEQQVEEEAKEYHSEYVPNNPFADLLKDYLK